jgi:hypothetical protein
VRKGFCRKPIEVSPKFAGPPRAEARASGPQRTSETLALHETSPTSETLALHETSPTSETLALHETTRKGARASSAHRGWHYRGYLPHFDAPGLVQFITFRLSDALPRPALHRIVEETKDAGERQERIEELLNAGHGACHLRDPRIARLIENALLHFEGERYRLLEWVVMPNHVHALIEIVPGQPLDRVIHSWKSFTAKAALNLLGGKAPFLATRLLRPVRSRRRPSACRSAVYSGEPGQGGAGREVGGLAVFERRECAGARR